MNARKMTLGTWRNMVTLTQRSFGKEVDEVARGLIANVAQHLKNVLGSPETMPEEKEIPPAVVPTISLLSKHLGTLFKERLAKAPKLTSAQVVGLVYAILTGRKVTLFMAGGKRAEGYIREVGQEGLRLPLQQAIIPAPPVTSPTWGVQPASAGVMNIDQVALFTDILGFEVVETGEDPR